MLGLDIAEKCSLKFVNQCTFFSYQHDRDQYLKKFDWKKKLGVD